MEQAVVKPLCLVIHTMQGQLMACVAPFAGRSVLIQFMALKDSA